MKKLLVLGLIFFTSGALFAGVTVIKCSDAKTGKAVSELYSDSATGITKTIAFTAGPKVEVYIDTKKKVTWMYMVDQKMCMKQAYTEPKSQMVKLLLLILE
jgi:hypothetical protein